MVRLLSSRGAVCIIALAVLSAGAVGEDSMQRKATAVRTALEKQGRAEDAALLEAATRASAITAIAMGGSPAAPEVIISTEGRPEFNWFKLDSGKRVVIDFNNAIHVELGNRLSPIGAGAIERVRSSLFALEPAFVTRVVIDLRQPAKPQFEQEDGRVVVRFGEKPADTDPNRDLAERAERIAAALDALRGSMESRAQELRNRIESASLAAPDGVAADEITQLLKTAGEERTAARIRVDDTVAANLEMLRTQEERLAELKTAVAARTIEHDEAGTALDSIEAELDNTAAAVQDKLASLEAELLQTFENRKSEFERVVAAAQPALETTTEQPAAPVEADIADDVPADSETKSAVASAIEQIERDLKSLDKNSESADPTPIAETEPAVVEAATVEPPASEPIDPTVFARLDGLGMELHRLAAAVENTTASPAAVNPDMQTTSAVPIELIGAPAAVETNASIARDADAQPVQVAQAEATPEPDESAAGAEESAPADAEEAAPAETEGQEAPTESAPAEEAEQSIEISTETAPAPAEAPAVVEPAAVEPAQPVKVIAAPAAEEREPLPAGMDPLDQPVNIDFREMDLASVVSLLAKKAQVNVIAGTEVTGSVTAEIRNVPLRKAMDMVLRMNGLGIVEEEGIFRIVPYEEAVAARRTSRLVPLTNAQAEDVRMTLEGILIGGRDQKLVTISANKNTNVIIISGPEDRVAEFERLARELDVKEPTLPTVTEAIKLNYLDPKMAKPIVDSIKTEKIGKVEIDSEGRHIIVTDIPAAVEQMKTLLADVDKPVKQVAIEAMIVDAVLRDASQTGVDWTIEAIRRHSRNGDLVSDVSQLQFDSDLGNIGSDALDAGILSLGILSSEVRINAMIAAEAQSRNAEILANPSIVTVENQVATISIVQEFPYQEITQGLTGPPVASTEFKPIGVTLEVTPRITHTNDTIVEINAKQSSVSGLTETGVPIEDKREATTTLRAENGKTIFIGGLRNVSDRLNVSKVPVLGDIPVLNFMFRNTDTEKVNTELLIFLKCNVLAEELPTLTASEQERYDKLDATPLVPDAQRANFRDILRPQDMRDPFWKWRRSNR